MVGLLYIKIVFITVVRSPLIPGRNESETDDFPIPDRNEADNSSSPSLFISEVPTMKSGSYIFSIW